MESSCTKVAEIWDSMLRGWEEGLERRQRSEQYFGGVEVDSGWAFRGAARRTGVSNGCTRVSMRDLGVGWNVSEGQHVRPGYLRIYAAFSRVQSQISTSQIPTQHIYPTTPIPIPLHSFPSFPLPPLPYPDIAPEKQETNPSKEKSLVIIRPQVQHHLPSACGIGGGATLPRDGLHFCIPFDIGMERNLIWRGEGWREG